MFLKYRHPFFYRCLLLLVIAILCGCNNIKRPAPIVESWQQPATRQGDYVVQPGDTLYSVAWAFDRDYRDLARINNLAPPYNLQVGQRLSMVSSTKRQSIALPLAKAKIKTKSPNTPVSTAVSQSIPSPKLTNKTATATQSTLPAPRNKKAIATTAPAVTPPVTNVAVKQWLWPTQGKVIDKFAPANGNKGIDISGKMGEPVVATAAGRVVYSGSGLRGYGNLLIIKHNTNYLSAYAYNKSLLVKEGIWVKAGQQIALMGANNGGKVMLHFEIRRNGKPVNPLPLLR